MKHFHLNFAVAMKDWHDREEDYPRKIEVGCRNQSQVNSWQSLSTRPVPTLPRLGKAWEKNCRTIVFHS